MATPAPVAAQLSALNVALNRLVADRERVQNVFEDNLGGSVWGLMTSQNQTVFKNAVVADMTAARDQITAVVNALAAM